MMSKAICTIDGIKYMNTRIASDMWGMKINDVRKACNEGRIAGLGRDTADRFIIPMTALKPLENCEIAQLLLMTLRLKNEPDLFVDQRVITKGSIRTVYDYLKSTGYICPYDISDDDRLPYDVVLTNKGFDTIIQSKEIKRISAKDALNTINSVLALINNILTLWATLA